MVQRPIPTEKRPGRLLELLAKSHYPDPEMSTSSPRQGTVNKLKLEMRQRKSLNGTQPAHPNGMEPGVMASN